MVKLIKINCDWNNATLHCCTLFQSFAGGNIGACILMAYIMLLIWHHTMLEANSCSVHR